MVMDQGHTVYFGPPDQARAYFEQLGYRSLLRQSTADYLTGCTDPNERQFAPGRSEADVPSTPTALEAAFRSSDLARDMADQLAKFKIRMETEKVDQEAFRAAVIEDKKKGVSPKSPYTLGLKDQVIALSRRQFQMRLQDKFQIYTSFGFMTVSSLLRSIQCLVRNIYYSVSTQVLAFFIGGCYYNLPPTSAGAFTRSSVLFMALLVSSFAAFVEVCRFLCCADPQITYAVDRCPYKCSVARLLRNRQAMASIALPPSRLPTYSRTCHSLPHEF
jgi:ATP-binding cassette, subfamily G (WHITE), member 2, SNQ2